MKYRTMRFIGGEENVSLLGLGCMRFPLNEDGTIDEAQAEAMIGRALNAGINYIDTAYLYHKGESEPFLGRALKNIRETALSGNKTAGMAGEFCGRCGKTV